jgi:hypothetical protein
MDYTPEQLKDLMNMFSIAPLSTKREGYICGCCGAPHSDTPMDGRIVVKVTEADTIHPIVEGWSGLVIPDKDINVTLTWKEKE